MTSEEYGSPLFFGTILGKKYKIKKRFPEDAYILTESGRIPPHFGQSKFFLVDNNGLVLAHADTISEAKQYAKKHKAKLFYLPRKDVKPNTKGRLKKVS